VTAANVRSEDKLKLEALLQTDDEQPAGAPQAAAYENQSGGVVALLEKLLAKFEDQKLTLQSNDAKCVSTF